MLVTQPFQSSENKIFVEVFLFSHHPVTGSGKFVRQRLSGNNHIARMLLFLVKAIRFVTAANGEVSGLNKTPGQVFIAVLSVVFR